MKNNDLKRLFLSIKTDTKIVLSIVILTFLLLSQAKLSAQIDEYYAGVKVKIKISDKQNMYLNLKEETRYKMSKHYYSKNFIGISKKIRPDLELTAYYALKRIKKASWKQRHMVWIEVISKRKQNYIQWESTSKLERHMTSKFWRLRQKIRILFPVYNRLSVWFGDELRYFFRDNRIGENEFQTGFSLPVVHNYKMEVFYSIRRFFVDGYLGDANCFRFSISAVF